MSPSMAEQAALGYVRMGGSRPHRLGEGPILGPGPETIAPGERLHRRFERRCDADPDRIAIVCGTARVCYAELDARANQLAHALVARGVRPGDRVGILLERSLHTYTTLLAVLKCGAAFVPLDPVFPPERLLFMAEDAGLRLLVTTSAQTHLNDIAPCPTVLLDRDAGAIARQPHTRLTTTTADDDPCYIMYTSGSTGRPKGVAVSHASLGNFLSACMPIYRVRPGDRVYQGMTIAFDFSIEEIWPTLCAGATLVAGPVDHRRLGPGLCDFLIEHGITILYCVPTLLATLDREIPSLQTLIVGGEACPHDLVARWSRPGRRILNTYGPTETTVTATWAELTPDRSVTIGRPLPTYTVHLLEEDGLNPVPSGAVGEICIGGPGVALGYINRPDLTATRFLPDPFVSDDPAARLYRTGDLGRWASGGEIEFLGRIDGQVKIRGYRLELAEIEAVLLGAEEVENAVVTVVAGHGGVEELAAYLTLRRPAVVDPDELRERLLKSLRRQLPAYMVPAFIEFLDAIPTLASGKADRARLPRPSGPRLLSAAPDDEAAPETPREQAIAACWLRVFGREIRSVTADFFLDLGGHSLFAALAVSELRRDPSLRHLAIADLYEYPTVRGLAHHAERATAVQDGHHEERRLHGSRRVLAGGAVQSALLYLCLIPWLAPGLAIVLLLEDPALSAWWVGASIAAVVAAVPWVSLLLPVIAKWAVLGRVKPGRYPLWGWFFCRWWLVRKLIQTAPLGYLAGSPLLAPYLRLLGARIGRDCHLGTGAFDVPDLVEIGDGAHLGYDVVLEPGHVANGWLHLAPIRIGAGAYLGTNSVVQGGGRVGNRACVAEQSLVACGQTIPDGETWAGSPSCRVAPDPQLEAMAALDPPGRWSVRHHLAFVLGFVLLGFLPSLLVVPGLVLIWGLSGGDLLRGLMLAPPAGLLQVLCTCVAVALGKRLTLPTVRPGIHAICSWFGFRKWLADRFMILSLELTNSLYSTLYLLPFLRLLGARVGPRAEVSTVSHIDPDLLTLGAETFVADLAVIGAARYHNGLLLLGETELGERGFVGNVALVPGDTRLGHDSLIGVLSVSPCRVEPRSSWLGSPPIYLPRRQASEAFDESRTFRPPARLVACRLAIECLRAILPASLGLATMFLIARATMRLAETLPVPTLALCMPAVYLMMAALVTLVVAALKWLVIGRYRPRVEPQWSDFVWRTEFITGLYENVAVPWLLHWLSGTPLMAPALRLFGASIGHRVYMESDYLTEFDLVHVGDDSEVSEATSLQTHLFEDRVMKMSTVKVGRRCTVGHRAVVLYDSELEDGSELDALSLVMKGETLPANTRWRGIPARLVE